ncbi:hypothetical protein I4U23_031095 [Adineta vaga]|nr:hypothetical protein I4U23_031095 [Adineta vaga]
MTNNETIDLTRLRWRFVICTCSFYVNVIIWGFLSSTGIFEDAFKITFQLSSFQSTLPGSIQIGTMSLMSIFTSILTIKYGVRRVTISGAFISTIGSILSASIGDYWAFCLFYGFMIGMGETLMLVPAILAIPPYFHSNRVSLATASAVSGASIGMLTIPFLLQYLLDKYGLRGATLLSSCLWLSVGLAGALFGKGILSIEQQDNENIDENEREYFNTTSHRSDISGNRVIYSRRTSLLPIPLQYHQQHLNSDRFLMNIPRIHEELNSNLKENSQNSLNSSPILLKSHTFQSSNINTHQVLPHSDHHSHLNIPSNKQKIQTSEISSKDFLRRIFSEISSVLRINSFRILIISMIFIWSLDETNFLFLIDLLKTTNQSEHRSTLLISIIGISDLIGQLFFG